MLDNLSSRQKQIASVIFSFLVFGLIFNWTVGFLLVIAVGFHEYSHLFAARQLGLKTKGFYILPFLGGVALLNDRFSKYTHQAIVVLAGPIGGGLLAILTSIAYFVTGIDDLGQAATWMLLLNLLNLLPLSFLDGGQLMDSITYSLSRRLGFYCFAASTTILVTLLFYTKSYGLGTLFLIFGGLHIYHQRMNLKHYSNGDYHLCSDYYLNPPKRLSVPQIFMVLGCWLLAAGVMGLFYLMLKLDPSTDYTKLFLSS